MIDRLRVASLLRDTKSVKHLWLLFSNLHLSQIYYGFQFGSNNCDA